jgi:uncharacterized surface protein with fasciclin (FAS1) repeats
MLLYRTNKNDNMTMINSATHKFLLMVATLLVSSPEATVSAFQLSSPRQRSSRCFGAAQSCTTKLYSSSEQSPDGLGFIDSSAVGEFISSKYPTFDTIVKSNDALWKALGESTEGFTIFVPSEEAMSALGETKVGQLQDLRNIETAEKIGMYHAISELVTVDQLFASGGVVTLGGEVPVGRSTTGGMFGFGGKEDGGILIQNAKIVQTWEVSTGLIHEVDALISPQILWRYVDQLRIPGSN